jgi:amidohydrolase
MIYGGKASADAKTILLRADIDALPIHEETGVSYASIHDGKMHACGHDAHVAMLLGAAKILTEMKDELEGNVKLLFQAAEETATGAKRYVDAGVLDNVDAVYGCHIATFLDAPYVNVGPGPLFASCDEFKITVKGVAAHGGAPNKGKDAIVAASNIVMNLQTIASRINDPNNPLVITVGTINGGQRFNIIANEVEMEGTVRTYSREFRADIDKQMNEVIQHAAQSMGCTAELQYDWKTGPIIHDNKMMNQVVKEAAEKLFDQESVVEMEKLTLSDDFAYFSEKVPGFYSIIGARNEEVGSVYDHHHERFNIDENSLKRGVAMHVQVALEFFLQ